MSFPLATISSLPKDLFLSSIMEDLHHYYVVILGIPRGLFFHSDCLKKPQREQEVDSFLQRHIVSYFDVSNIAQDLDISLLSRFIIQNGYSECQCSLKEKISIPRAIPYKKHVKIE